MDIATYVFPTPARPTTCAKPWRALRDGSRKGVGKGLRPPRSPPAAEKHADAIDSEGLIDFGCQRLGRLSAQTTDISLDTTRGGNVRTAVTARTPPAPARTAAKPWYKVLYVQVLIAIVLGALFVWLAPD